MSVQRSRKILKIGVGIFMIIFGISYYFTGEGIRNEVPINHLAFSTVWIIVGILIILGTGKIKELIIKSK